MKHKYYFYLFFHAYFLLFMLPHSASSQSQANDRGTFRFLIGVTVPYDNFSTTSGLHPGYAKEGVALSVEKDWPLWDSFFWVNSFTFSFNSANEPSFRRTYGFVNTPPGVSVDVGSYYFAFGLTGIGYQIQILPEIKFMGAFQLGILTGILPSMKVSGGGNTYISQSAANNNAFAYGLSGDFSILNQFHVGLKYQAGNPKYNGTYFIQNSGYYDFNNAKQSVKLIQFYVGVGLDSFIE